MVLIFLCFRLLVVLSHSLVVDVFNSTTVIRLVLQQTYYLTKWLMMMAQEKGLSFLAETLSTPNNNVINDDDAALPNSIVFVLLKETNCLIAWMNEVKIDFPAFTG